MVHGNKCPPDLQPLQERLRTMVEGMKQKSAEEAATKAPQQGKAIGRSVSAAEVGGSAPVASPLQRYCRPSAEVCVFLRFLWSYLLRRCVLPPPPRPHLPLCV
jgi:hypothetical protein